jgi:hypothetical protein
MKHGSPLLFLIYFLPAILSTNSLASESVGKPPIQGKHDFAFVIDCPNKESNKICLLGKFERGIPTTLLEIGRSKTCVVKTEEGGDYEGPVTGSFSYTAVSPLSECGDASLYGVAVLGSRITNYRIVKMEEITDRGKVQSLDRLVRKKNVFEMYRGRAQGMGAEDYQISKDLPIIHRYPIPNMETFILSYKTLLGYEGEADDVARGPRVIIVNKIAYPLTGWCSYPYMRAFCLNREYYIESGSHCCECGIAVNELLKITRKGPVEVYSDGSLSD